MRSDIIPGGYNVSRIPALQEVTCECDRPAVQANRRQADDIHSFVDVTPLLASAGYRVMVPFVRGYGTTRFLSDDTLRNGQQAAVAVDVIALMDALKIEKAILKRLRRLLRKPSSTSTASD